MHLFILTWIAVVVHDIDVEFDGDKDERSRPQCFVPLPGMNEVVFGITDVQLYEFGIFVREEPSTVVRQDAGIMKGVEVEWFVRSRCRGRLYVIFLFG
jgi:hypothetical protein